jgi:hypothetical protein
MLYTFVLLAHESIDNFVNSCINSYVNSRMNNLSGLALNLFTCFKSTSLSSNSILKLVSLRMKPVEVRLVGRFRLTSKVQGHHEHLLYKAVHTQTDASLFLKGEEIKSKPPVNFLTILQEGKILQTMQGGIGIPHMYWCGQEEDYNFIVL